LHFIFMKPRHNWYFNVNQSAQTLSNVRNRKSVNLQNILIPKCVNTSRRENISK